MVILTPVYKEVEVELVQSMLKEGFRVLVPLRWAALMAVTLLQMFEFFFDSSLLERAKARR